MRRVFEYSIKRIVIFPLNQINPSVLFSTKKKINMYKKHNANRREINFHFRDFVVRIVCSYNKCTRISIIFTIFPGAQQ